MKNVGIRRSGESEPPPQHFSEESPPHDCFLNVKMSRFLEPLLLTGGGVGVWLGEDDEEGEEF